MQKESLNPWTRPATRGLPSNFLRPWGRLFQLILSPVCPVCKAPLGFKDSFICTSCKREIRPVTGPKCGVCGLPFKSRKGEDHLCQSCQDKGPWFDMARSLFFYEGPISKLIKNFKYHNDFSSLGALCHVSKDPLEGSKEELLGATKDRDFYVLPVPLTLKKLRSRTFNQTVLLAKRLFPKDRILMDCLFKRLETLPQSGLGLKERKKNVKGAFSLKGDLSGLKVVVFDDVMTTGSTVNEIASLLKKRGRVSFVGVLTISRAVF